MNEQKRKELERVTQAVFYDSVQEKYNEAEALLREHIGTLAQPKDWKAFVSVALNIDSEVNALLYDEELVDAFYKPDEYTTDGLTVDVLEDWEDLKFRLEVYINRNQETLGIQ